MIHKLIRKISDNKVLFVLYAVALVIHSYALGSLPAELHFDEAGMAYDAWCLAHYGVDRYLKSWPVYMNNYGSGQSSLYAWLAALCIKVFGFSVSVVRIPAVVFSILTLIFGVKIVRLLTKAKLAEWIYAILYIVCPYFLMAGRFGLDCNLMLGASTVFLYFLMKAIESQRNRDFMICGMIGGVMLYTYALSYFVLPIFLLLAISSLLLARKLTLNNIFSMGTPMFLLAVPLLLVQYINMTGQEEMRLGIFTITSLTEYRIGEIERPLFVRLFYSLMCILFYDRLEYNTLPEFGTLYHFSIPFCVIGFVITIGWCIWRAFKKKWSMECLLIFWFFAELLLGSMLAGTGGANANKLNAVFFVLIYFATIAIYKLSTLYRLSKWWRNSILACIFTVYMTNAVGFFQFYFITQVNEDKYNILF